MPKLIPTKDSAITPRKKDNLYARAPRCLTPYFFLALYHGSGLFSTAGTLLRFECNTEGRDGASFSRLAPLVHCPFAIAACSACFSTAKTVSAEWRFLLLVGGDQQETLRRIWQGRVRAGFGNVDVGYVSRHDRVCAGCRFALELELRHSHRRTSRTREGGDRLSADNRMAKMMKRSFYRVRNHLNSYKFSEATGGETPCLVHSSTQGVRATPPPLLSKLLQSDVEGFVNANTQKYFTDSALGAS